MFAQMTCAFLVVALALFVTPAPSIAAESSCPTVLNHKFANLMDEPVSLCQFSGKVLLIVNTASECGYTPQYDGLKSYIADIATKASRSWDFRRTISAPRSRGQTKRSRNSVG